MQPYGSCVFQRNGSLYFLLNYINRFLPQKATPFTGYASLEDQLLHFLFSSSLPSVESFVFRYSKARRTSSMIIVLKEICHRFPLFAIIFFVPLRVFSPYGQEHKAGLHASDWSSRVTFYGLFFRRL